jgi:hypothetical protein
MQDSDEKAIMRTTLPRHDHPIVSFSEYKPYSCRHAKVPSNEKSVIIKKPHQRQCAEWMWSKKAKRPHSHRNALLLFCLNMTLRLTFLHAVVVAISSPWNNLQRHVSWLVGEECMDKHDTRNGSFPDPLLDINPTSKTHFQSHMTHDSGDQR